MDQHELIRSITAVFAGVTLGDGIGLSEADALDDQRDAAFRAACREQDERRHWGRIPVNALNKHHCGLSYFDAEGMRFHLPAFLIAEIKGTYRFDLRSMLTDPSDHTQAQLGLLDDGQRAAVRLFLHYLRQHPDHAHAEAEITTALERYWSR